jgi:transposase
MDYLTYQERIDYLNKLVQEGKATSPINSTKRWNCSEKTVRNMINRLRGRGIDIRYCRKQKKYFVNNL